MTYNATQRISAFFLALVLALAAWTCVEGQELQVNSAVEAEWFRAWEKEENEVAWCGYGTVHEGTTVVIADHKRPEIEERTPTGLVREPCPPYRNGRHLVATIHTHPSLEQLKGRISSFRWHRIRAWRKRHYGTTKYECDLSQRDRNAFSEAARFGEGSVQVSIVVCAPYTYAYRTASNIYGGEPVVVERSGTN